jgi:DNA polymerase-4
MDRRIVYFEIPTFEIALAQRQDPALRNRPVAMAPIHTTRSCLREVSPEAMEHGIRPGMPIHLARRLCPTIHLIPTDGARVETGHRRLQRIVAEFAPVWEPILPGHLFLDLTGTQRLFGSALDAAARIEREVLRRERLAGVAGIGSSKLVSNIAASSLRPLQLYQVDPGSEQHFLAPVATSIFKRFHHAFSPKLLALLEDLNLQTLGQIAEIPVAHLELVLGASARLLFDWACGKDPSPVLPTLQQPSLERSLALSPDMIDDDHLLRLLYGLLEQICRTLRRQHRLCGRLTVMIRHSDRVELQKSRRLEKTSCWESELYPVLKQLFFETFRRRIRLRAITVRAEVLNNVAAPFTEQLSLFDTESPESLRSRDRSRRLSVALDQVRHRFGEEAIAWGDSSAIRTADAERLRAAPGPRDHHDSGGLHSPEYS